MKIRIFSLFVLLGATLTGQNLNPKPVRALGAPRLIATQANPLAADTANPNWVEGKELYNPSDVALDTSGSVTGVYIADTRNNRVLGWKNAQVQPGTPADVVLGQPGPYQTSAGGPGTASSLGLNAPTGLVVDLFGNVYVADSNNNRILRFPTPFLTTGTQILPDLVIGQSSFTTNGANQGGVSASSLSLGSGAVVPLHAGLALDTAGSLYVSDVNNNRVLVFPASVPAKNGVRVAASEVMVNTPYVSELIKKGDVIGVKEAIRTGTERGMLSFDNSLYNLVREGRIDMEEALANADSRTNLEAKINFG